VDKVAEQSRREQKRQADCDEPQPTKKIEFTNREQERTKEHGRADRIPSESDDPHDVLVGSKSQSEERYEDHNRQEETESDDDDEAHCLDDKSGEYLTRGRRKLSVRINHAMKAYNTIAPSKPAYFDRQL
jgi:hypothetical protein